MTPHIEYGLGEYWCKHCGCIVKEKDTKIARNGRRICPDCKKGVRTKPLKKKLAMAVAY
jgi:Zn finger protein HypA/HybF involved in hydrogenase expression